MELQHQMPLDASFFARTSTVASKLLFIGQLEDRSLHVYLLRSRFSCIRVQRSFAVCRFRKITTKDVSYKTCLHNGATLQLRFVPVSSACSPPLCLYPFREKKRMESTVYGKTRLKTGVRYALLLPINEINFASSIRLYRV